MNLPEMFANTPEMLMFARWQWVAAALLGFVGLSGLLALVSPRLFSRVAAYGSIWVDTDRWLKRFDRRLDVDPFVLRHCRLFGLLSIAAVIWLTALLF